MRPVVLVVAALVALSALAGCNRSRRACDKIAAMEAAESGPVPEGSAVLEQLARTQRDICIVHLDLFREEGDAAYAEALACADLPTSAAARQCLDRLSQPPGASTR